MRRTQAATIIQKYQRMCMERKRYRQKQAAALAMQTILRAYMARQKYQAVRSHKKTSPLSYQDSSLIKSHFNHCTLKKAFGNSSPNLLKRLISSSAFARTQGSNNPKVHSGLVGPVLVQALPGGHRLPAVLHS